MWEELVISRPCSLRLAGGRVSVGASLAVVGKNRDTIQAMALASIPLQFADRFAVVREITRADLTGAGIWIVRDLKSGVPWLLKCARYLTRPDVLAYLRQVGPGSGLLFPSEQGALDTALGFELTPLPAEDVRDLATPASATEWLQIGRQVVGQLTSALSALHARRNGAWVLHGDVKPANVVWYRDRDGGLQFGLVDFDAALVLGQPNQAPARLARLTPAYAAPEVLGGGRLTEEADYWSLGMLVLEQLLGRHPLGALSVELQRGAIAGAWRPDTSSIASSEWRALLGGLLQREAALRWGASEVERWLAGEAGMISLGLSLAGESSSAVPFIVVGHPAYSAESLARQMLREWCSIVRLSAVPPAQPDARAIDAEPLLSWLRNDLSRPDVANLLEQLLDDESLSPEMRILHFARELWPGMPASWQRRALDAAGLDSAAAAALAGSDADMRWLREARDSGALAFFDRQGYGDVASAAREWAATQERYAAAWDALLQRGAPQVARPSQDQELALATRMAFSAEYQTSLREDVARLLDPVDWMSRQPWFLHFGSDPARMLIEQIAVLRQLDRPSRQEILSLDNFAALRALAPNQAQSCLVISRGEQRRLRKLLVAPGAATIELLPGSVFAPRPRPAVLVAAWRTFNSWVQRQYSWFRRVRTDTTAAQSGNQRPDAASTGSAQVQTGVPLALQVRLTELTLPDAANALGSMPIYATRVAWQAPAGSELTLRIRRLGRPRADRLRLRQLPVQAQIGLLLSESCRIDLVCRTGPLSWQRTRPIDLDIPAAPGVIESERRLVGVGKLVPSRERFDLAQEAPPPRLGPEPAMCKPDRMMVDTSAGLVPSESRGMDQADTHLLASVRPYQGIEAQLATVSGLFYARPYAESTWARLRRLALRRQPGTGSVT